MYSMHMLDTNEIYFVSSPFSTNRPVLIRTLNTSNGLDSVFESSYNLSNINMISTPEIIEDLESGRASISDMAAITFPGEF